MAVLDELAVPALRPPFRRPRGAGRAPGGRQRGHQPHQPHGARDPLQRRTAVSFSVGIPYFMAARSSGLRAANRVIGRPQPRRADGVGDIISDGAAPALEAARAPERQRLVRARSQVPHRRATASKTRGCGSSTASRSPTTETVDQSIQPGDGGFGSILDVQGFQRVPNNNGTALRSAHYLINPTRPTACRTFRGGSGEEIMSVADQYLARVGVAYAGKSWKGVGRQPGRPPRRRAGGGPDRRQRGLPPARATPSRSSPGVSYSRGPTRSRWACPYALYRNRTRSVPDRAVPGRHGDAAFADYIIILGYWRRVLDRTSVPVPGPLARGARLFASRSCRSRRRRSGRSLLHRACAARDWRSCGRGTARRVTCGVGRSVPTTSSTLPRPRRRRKNGQRTGSRAPAAARSPRSRSRRGRS